ncbi:MAG: UvrD-helicase domain-containing protein [Ignavibacteriales bacterium]|nr:UvrD-helicase domain-containing protein [Ignavibacteriales bacterium]
MHQLTPQQKEAINYKTHISLAANAGSGKTFVLSKRFVEIFLNEEIDLSSIVAITFTDKSAGELSKKIASEVDERIVSETGVQKRRKLESLRRQLVSANISTIHSFCINILREFSPEAGIDANFNPIDQNTSSELIELSVEETINSLIENKEYSGELKYLIRFFGSKKIFTQQLENSINKRRIIEQLNDSFYLKDENEIAGLFKQKFQNEFKELFSSQIINGLNIIGIINEFVLRQKSNNETALAILEQLSKYSKEKILAGQLAILSSIKNLLLTKTDGKLRNRGYLSKNRDELEKEIAEVESLLADLNDFLSLEKTEEAEKELANFGKAFIKIHLYMKSLYTQKKKQKGFLDFEDILLFTQKILLRDEVRKYLSDKFKYIMIDEYQDTNELQYEIFMPILDHLKSGNLFVVGDEKQSIYMFRNAEPEVFERTKEEINLPENKGQILSLPHSFRMSPQLVLFTNLLFKNLFKNPNPHFNDVAQSSLICAKDETEKGNVEFLLADEDSDVTESELTANKILQLASLKTDSAIAFKEIAVLCRKRDSFAELEKSFVKHGIPFTIVGGKGFYQRQTIYDIYNYLAFLLNKEDDAALVGLLRSPFFSLSDLQLYKISLENGNSFFEKVMNLSNSNIEIKIVCDKLNENLKIAYNSEIYSIIRKILLESGYWSVIASKQNSSQELANNEKLLSLARTFSKKSFKNLYDFTVFLLESIEGYEDEGQAQVARDENTVKLLTIHQAKGLEFKAVFLYGCNQKTQEDSIRAKSLSIDKNYGLLTKVPLSKNYFNTYSSAPIAALYNYTIKRKNAAEVKRLLYVAVTRAINYLFITATHKEFSCKPGTFLHLFSEGLETDFTTDKISLSSQVDYMKFSDDKYESFARTVSLTIPVTTKLDETVSAISAAEQKKEEIIQLTQKINDVPKREIISATKISMFTQCPVKYQLTYELGYSTIYKLIKEKTNDYEFSSNEDDEMRPFGQIKGRLIHAALKDEISGEKLQTFLLSKIAAEDFSENETVRNKFITTIVNDLEQFYKSAGYSEISSSKNYKNEFEIYCEEGEHYLYGIIDRLIIEKDKLIIIDYKTDNITSEQLISRTEDYLPQLKFYAYILSKLFRECDLFELRIIFLKYADHTGSYQINRNDLKIFGTELNEATSKIYSEQFKPNLNHCSKCHYALEGNKCVKLFS